MQIYLVGGAVRDELLNRKVTEKDYVVVGATPQQMLDKGFTQVGKDFPVFLHPKTKEEYALARTERKSGRGYTGFVCDASASVTLKEDLLRRDLTINAMAKDADGHITDPFNGQQDLTDRLLRHVSDAFVEDPLRVFRVARFAARYAHLGFSVAEETMRLMREVAKQDELAHLSAERVWSETQRSLMERDPQVYFDTLQQADALFPWLSELAALNTPTWAALKLSAERSLKGEIRFAVLACSLSTEQASSLGTRLKAPNSFCELAVLAANFASELTQPVSANRLLDIFNQADGWRKADRFRDLLDVSACMDNCPALQPSVILHALNAAKSVDTQPIIQAGFKGAAIKSQLNKQRMQVITQILADKGGTA
ncbi:CCA tRNA nucleotidyltransferase [Alteromonas sp. ASW11-130]|uniref:CCA tRNA nucleotidyltransferase n=1 Tax=Alteromonas sp. ASW11-130 TaxID=3015775 RepID=UPI002242C2F3|nr:CCA tRNA nucleotidyltransferase [Alteromonas sp. ASW11-130]MCW8092807.1 CCA tRNA nucleotidyltransferase [Alteromonas sp. ASW11-130]